MARSDDMHVIYDIGNSWSFVTYDDREGDNWPILFYQGTPEYHCGLCEQWYSLEDAVRIVAALTEIIDKHGGSNERQGS